MHLSGYVHWKRLSRWQVIYYIVYELLLVFKIIIEVTVTIPPQIIDPPKTTATRLYSSTRLTCKATGSPAPTILWYKDNTHISNNNPDPSILTFTELDVNDRGFYYCEARSFINGRYESVNSSAVLVNITSNYYHSFSQFMVL